MINKTSIIYLYCEILIDKNTGFIIYTFNNKNFLKTKNFKYNKRHYN